MIRFLKQAAILISFAIISSGCSSSYSVSKINHPNSDYNYNELNNKLRGRYATVELKDGRKIFTNLITITNDSVSLFDFELRILSRYNISSIKNIIVNNRINGFFEGLGLGVIGGAVVGSIIAAGSSHSGTDGPIGLYSFLISTAVGSGIGAITGTIIGDISVYEFPYN
jgi:hypothetical protein